MESPIVLVVVNLQPMVFFQRNFHGQSVYRKRRVDSAIVGFNPGRVCAIGGNGS